MKSEADQNNIPKIEAVQQHGEIVEAKISSGQRAEIVLRQADEEIGQFKQAGLPKVETMAKKYGDQDVDQETKDALGDLVERARDADERLKIKILIGQASDADFDFKRIPQELQSQVCLGLIEKGQAETVVQHLGEFTGLNKEIAKLLIEKGQEWDVSPHLDKFSGLDKEVATLLIEKGQEWAVDQHLDKFSGLDRETANLLIEKYWAESVVQHLDKFVGLDQKEVANLMIEKGQAEAVARHLDKFVGLDHKEIATLMIKKDQVEAIVQHLDNFAGPVDHKEIATLTIEKGQAEAVVQNLDKFVGLDHKEIATLMIEKDQAGAVAQHLDKFVGLNKEIAKLLIEKGRARDVVENINKFPDVDQETAKLLVEKGRVWDVVQNLDKFVGLDHKEIATLMIEKDQAGAVAQHLDKFVGLNKEIAKLLIEKGRARDVVENINKFPDVDQETAKLLVEKGQAEAVVQNLDKFVGLDHKEIATLMIEKDQAGAVAQHLDKFVGLNKEIAKLLIEKYWAGAVAQHLDKFAGLDHKEIATLIIEKYQAEAVVKNLDKFTEMNHKEIAILMIEKGQAWAVAQHLDKFAGLDKEIADLLIEKGKVETIVDYIEQFKWIISDLITEKKLQAVPPNELVKLGQTISDRFLYSFEEEPERAIQQQKKNREAVLSLFEGMSKDQQQTLLPNLIEHAMDPDFGDSEVVKSLIEKIDDPDQRTELQKITPESFGNVEDRITKFQQKLEALSKSNRESTLAGMIAVHGQEKVEETMREIEKDIFFTINLSLDAVGKVIEVGCLKSSWETKTRDDDSYAKQRDRVERNLGIRSKGTEKDPHPVYGAVGYRNGQDELKGVAPGYGECFIKLKNEEVKKRGAFTYGDTFHGEVTSRQFCLKDVAVARAKVALDKTDYVDLQMLGGVTLDDVESINIPRQLEAQYAARVKELQEKIPHIPINFV